MTCRLRLKKTKKDTIKRENSLLCYKFKKYLVRNLRKYFQFFSFIWLVLIQKLLNARNFMRVSLSLSLSLSLPTSTHTQTKSTSFTFSNLHDCTSHGVLHVLCLSHEGMGHTLPSLPYVKNVD